MNTLRMFLTSMFVLCCSVVYASFIVDGIYYEVTNSTDRTVCVTYRYYNTMDNRTAYSGDIVIPETVETEGRIYRVTSINSYAFYYCSDMLSVEIPNSVTSIGKSAFNCCSSLTSVVIPNSVTSIGDDAFWNCSGLTSVVIPNSVTSIGENPFVNCDALTSIIVEEENPIYDSRGGCNAIIESVSNVLIGGCSSSTIPNGVTSIGKSAFLSCDGLTSVEIPNSVTSICGLAFANCSGLTAVVIPKSVKTIDANAFYQCFSLTSVNIEDIVAWCKIDFYSKMSNPLLYAEKLYLNGEEVTNLVIPNSVTSIGDYAFYYCTGLTTVVVPNSVTSIGISAFEGCSLEAIYLLNPTPVGYDNLLGSQDVIFVPEESLEAYCTAPGWSDFAGIITSPERGIQNIEVTALASGSAVKQVIGNDDILDEVYSLTIQGTINSYDIVVLNKKMPRLRNLDLSEATIVACDYPYYGSYCTKANTLGAYMFYQTGFRYVKLPKNIVGTLGDYAFGSCSRLKNITIPDGITAIGSNAFSGYVQTEGGSTALKSIVIPEGVETIGKSAFQNSGVTTVQLPKSLKVIGDDAFRYSALKEITLPPSLESIGSGAFASTYVTEIRLPSTLKTLGIWAFDCHLEKVYTYTILPLSIKENTFSNTANAELYLPETSSDYYYFAPGWNKFLVHKTFNEPYKYFYLNGDFTVDDNTGFVEGEDGEHPDADINIGGGLVVEGEQSDSETPNQSLGNVNLENDGNGNSGSIIGDNNLTVDNLNIKINVTSGKWYFFAFPFDIMLEDISLSDGGSYVWRYYDGAERANGKTGWKTVNGNKLNAAQGYIFQCSKSGVLTLNIENVRFKKEDKYLELLAHVSANLKDASWNFMGNPYLSYYDMSDMNYTAPVTVWDGSKYVAMRPGDDEYHFAPFQTFFVQKSEGTASVGFQGDKQMTQKQSQNKKAQAATAPKMQVMSESEEQPARQLINLVLTSGEQTDGTRIVFNEAQSRAYEAACDAAKFETQGVIQLFTIGDQKERYAINERPADNGIVALGFSTPTAGDFTISAARMDTPVYLKDRETGSVYDLRQGAYQFSAGAGTHANRFEVLLEATVTGIQEVGTATEGDATKVYDLGGRRVKENGKGVYIINGEKTLVK